MLSITYGGFSPKGGVMSVGFGPTFKSESQLYIHRLRLVCGRRSVWLSKDRDKHL